MILVEYLPSAWPIIMPSKLASCSRAQNLDGRHMWCLSAIVLDKPSFFFFPFSISWDVSLLESVQSTPFQSQVPPLATVTTPSDSTGPRFQPSFADVQLQTRGTAHSLQGTAVDARTPPFFIDLTSITCRVNVLSPYFCFLNRRLTVGGSPLPIPMNRPTLFHSVFFFIKISVLAIWPPKPHCEGFEIFSRSRDQPAGPLDWLNSQRVTLFPRSLEKGHSLPNPRVDTDEWWLRAIVIENRRN